ncbi:MAG: hypothetical protein HC836_45565 [Richelia sp. RM2_1_2]|nr:hypothetical protein [Richelia sp. SM1_7_0]NJN13212.1 hypothetical protein [Richelia sp. RM1_1_1]NJO27160.1 hypothetical protein [Richelia sp. SL_2_1]NJO65125.1 hypothetical protein [Richelia sp. RM2_1_2]
MIHQIPPANIEAEEAVLGGILLDPQAIVRVRSHLISEAFYIKAHQEIYDAALQLDNQGKPTDLLTIISWLNDHNLLVQVGGRNKLASLVDRTVSAVNIDFLADLIVEKYRRRLVALRGQELVSLISNL